ncbi:MAG: 2Fe-2S iron-sulfur cluster binding domain-containing protein [Microthrixaceae bacterium]|nr:2Fe-2S iron-sulfur cluster binding domain-containing protein [Acidimicrobiales bacterium]MCB9403066.1 2Fe-2S iron-sulfur cluster binding domain-containing protein [Microthrixaceae bacterium]
MTSLVDRLFTPHGAAAYLRWLPPRSARAVYSGSAVPRRQQPAVDVGVETLPMEGTTFVRSGVTAEGDGTLLEVAEGAGLTPPNRCRRGVCATCTTALVSGTVRDGRTGELVEGPAPVRLCVSVAEGPVVLDL